MPDDTPEQLLLDGRIADAVAAVKRQVVARPGDAGLRFAFAQVMAVVGRWDEAALAGRTAGGLDAGRAEMGAAIGVLARAEQERAGVFAGRHLPVLFGDPPPYAASYALANRLAAAGDADGARALRAEAAAAAPDTPGVVDGRPFDYFLDGDDRLGPMCEAVLGGRYHWLPFALVRKIELREPTAVHEVVWGPAVFTLANFGVVPGFIPARYDGSEASADPAIRMATLTTWDRQPDAAYRGLGQRVFRAGGEAVGQLSVRTIEFADAGGPTGVPPAGAP